MDTSQGWFGWLLDAAGSGRSPAARVRRWSAVVLFVMGPLAIVGALMWFVYQPTVLDAADFEAGRRSDDSMHHARSSGPRACEIKGRLLPNEITVESAGSRRMYAPLVSDRPGAWSSRIYFGGPEQSFRRAAAEKHYVGILYPYLVRRIRAQLEADGREPPDDMFTLEADTRADSWAATGRSLLALALLVGLLALAAFVSASRRNKE